MAGAPTAPYRPLKGVAEDEVDEISNSVTGLGKTISLGSEVSMPRTISCTSSGGNHLAHHMTWKSLIWEFARAVVPLTIFIVLYLGIMLDSWIFTLEMFGGLTCVIVGLAIFKFGLITGLMPFGESIGKRLPRKVPLWAVFLVSFLLGLLVTYSEPGVNSLQLVGKIMHHPWKAGGHFSEPPLSEKVLLEVLSKARTFQLLTSVAVGVGMASMFGLVRLLFRFGMKPFIVLNILPLLGLTWYCSTTNSLNSIVGVSWDCGAITTGPATVPIVLSLGIGVAKHARRSRPLSLEGGTSPAADESSSALDGFGIVTLASLVPVFTVAFFSIYCGTFGDAVNHHPERFLSELDILPFSFIHGFPKEEYDAWDEFPLQQFSLASRAVVPICSFLIFVQSVLIRELPQHTTKARLALGIFATFIGLFIFNTGLKYGSIPLGHDAGVMLPRALKTGTIFSDWGLAAPDGWCTHVVIMLFGFVCGFIATFIDLEPCGLGETVERLSRGSFTKMDLLVSVASGVGIGIVLGFSKILYQLNLFFILVVGYTVALILSLFTEESLLCVAWDSAGVASGPVTVPLTLSLGVGICRATGHLDGFGILACAAITTIISVLVVAMLRTSICPHRPRKRESTKLSIDRTITPESPEAWEEQLLNNEDTHFNRHISFYTARGVGEDYPEEGLG